MDKKKMAALGAVMEVLRAEKEAEKEAERLCFDRGSARANLWGISGRQSMMRMRHLLQMRAFRGGMERARGREKT